MELNLKITGVLLIVLGLMHGFFPKYFDWKKDMDAVSLINRQMMYVHAFFVGFVLLLMGALCLSSAQELLLTPLGKKVAAGIGIFWVVRLFIQFFGYSPQLWRGKRFETGVHIVFSLLWIYLSCTFLAIPWIEN